jgi:hypothetical protein
MLIVLGVGILWIVVERGAQLAPSLWHLSATSKNLPANLPWPEDQSTPVAVAVHDANNLNGSILPGVSDVDFADVADDMPFRPEESTAWFRLFEILRETPDDDIRRNALDGVDYATLHRQPGEYRGRLVRLHGTVRRVVPMPAPSNDLGIERYYQVWLFPRTQPVVAYCLSLPEGFPTGDEISEEATFDGVFYKRWAYRAVEGPRTAPVLAALEPRWLKRPAPVAPQPQPRGLWIVFLATALAALALAALLWFPLRRKRHSVSQGATGPAPDEDFLKHLAQEAGEGPQPPS